MRPMRLPPHLAAPTSPGRTHPVIARGRGNSLPTKLPPPGLPYPVTARGRGRPCPAWPSPIHRPHLAAPQIHLAAPTDPTWPPPIAPTWCRSFCNRPSRLASSACTHAIEIGTDPSCLGACVGGWWGLVGGWWGLTVWAAGGRQENALRRHCPTEGALPRPYPPPQDLGPLGDSILCVQVTVWGILMLSTPNQLRAQG